MKLLQFLHRVQLQIGNLLRDLRYGRSLRGSLDSRFAEYGAFETVNSEYRALDVLCGQFVRAGDRVVDVGCGKGRVLNWFLNDGRAVSIVGIEIDPKVAAETATRLASYERVSVICGDASRLLPADCDLIYLYNPFGRDMMNRFKERVLEIAKSTDFGTSRLRIIYYNPQEREVFDRDDRFVVHPIELADFPHGAVIIRINGQT